MPSTPKVFSPYHTPAGVESPLLWRADGTAEPLPFHNRAFDKAPTTHDTLKVLSRHPHPQRPIMLGVIPPNVQPMRNRLPIQNRRKLNILIQTNIPIRRSQHNLHLPVPAQEPVVRHVRQKVRRTIEITVIVVIPIQKLMNVERPAHAHAMGYYIRMLQRKIHRMIPAKTASCHGQPRCLILPADKWQQFMQNVALILQVPQHAHPRMHTLVVPALAIHAVRTKYLQFAAIDLSRQHANHSPIFILEKPSLRSRNHEQRRSRMPKNQRLYVPVQFLAVGFVIFAIHRAAENLCAMRSRVTLLATFLFSFRSRSILPDESSKP